jgi:hypothetical protein
MKGGRNEKNEQPNTAKNHKKTDKRRDDDGLYARGLFFVIFKEHNDD